LLVDRIESGSWTVQAAAEAAGISQRTARKWLARWRAEGVAGHCDRSSAPKTVANKTPAQTVELLAALRRLRFTAPELSALLGLPVSTVSAVLKRIGMGKLGRLGLEPPVRYERQRPGELIHIDVKKLGHIVGGAGKRVTGKHGTNGHPQRRDSHRRKHRGWQAVHVAIDDATRLAYVEVLPDEKASPAAFCTPTAAASSAAANSSAPSTAIT
jgi:transposase